MYITVGRDLRGGKPLISPWRGGCVAEDRYVGGPPKTELKCEGAASKQGKLYLYSTHSFILEVDRIFL